MQNGFLHWSPVKDSKGPKNQGSNISSDTYQHNGSNNL